MKKINRGFASICLGLILGLVLLPTLGTLCCCAPIHAPLRPETPLYPSDQRVQSAWSLACEQGGAPRSWRNIPPIMLVHSIVVDPDGSRVLGRYLVYFEVDQTGHFVCVEQILVYLMPHEDEMLPKILVHEFLHSIWQRRGLMDEGFKAQNPNSELWVCSLGACY